MTEINTQAYEIKEKLLHLEQALLEKSPEMPTLLHTIHTNLRKDPELTTILSEEEVCILVKGLARQTNTVITTSALKKKSGNKALKNLGVDDL